VMMYSQLTSVGNQIVQDARGKQLEIEGASCVRGRSRALNEHVDEIYGNKISLPCAAIII